MHINYECSYILILDYRISYPIKIKTGHTDILVMINGLELVKI